MEFGSISCLLFSHVASNVVGCNNTAIQNIILFRRFGENTFLLKEMLVYDLLVGTTSVQFFFFFFLSKGQLGMDVRNTQF